MTQAAVASPFIRIPSHILQADVSKTALRVYLMLAAQATPKRSAVLVNCNELAHALERSASTIRRAVRELMQHGLLEWTKEWVNRATRVFRFVFDAVKSVGDNCRVQPSAEGARRTEKEQSADLRCASPDGSAAPYISTSNHSENDEIPGQARDDATAPAPLPSSLVPEVYNDRKTYPHFKVAPEETHEIERIGEAMVRLGLEIPSAIRLITKYSYQRCDLELKRIEYITRLGTDVTITEEYFDRALKCRVDMETT